MWAVACVVMLSYLFDDEIVIAFCVYMGDGVWRIGEDVTFCNARYVLARWSMLQSSSTCVRVWSTLDVWSVAKYRFAAAQPSTRDRLLCYDNAHRGEDSLLDKRLNHRIAL